MPKRQTSVALAAALVAIGLIMPTFGAAQASPGESPDPACVSRPDCRFVGVVTLRTDQGVKTPALNRNMPFIRTKDGDPRLWMVMGERVDLRLGGQGEPAFVVLGHGLASDPQKSKAKLKDVIEVELAQLPNSTSTIMTVHNGYTRQLQYRAFQLTKRGDDRPTSVCGVAPGIFSVESWPGPVIEIELADFRLADVQINAAGSITISCQ